MRDSKAVCYSAMLSIALLILALGCKPPSASPNPAGQASDPVAANQEEPTAPAPLPEPQRANVKLCKAGAKLRDNNDAQKIITGAPGIMLDVKSSSVLDIKIPHALNLFKAEHGRVPKNHAEFMSRIVEFNNLTLPELLDGLVYQFNPEKEELWAYPKDKVPAEK